MEGNRNSHEHCSDCENQEDNSYNWGGLSPANDTGAKKKKKKQNKKKKKKKKEKGSEKILAFKDKLFANREDPGNTEGLWTLFIEPETFQNNRGG